MRPFTLPSQEYFHTSGPPLALTSAQYATEFNEVKALGRATLSTRTAAQTLLAYWSAAHPVPMLYAAMRQVAASKGLTITAQARFHAMTSHGRGGQPDQLLGGKGALGLLAPDDGDPARRHRRQPDTDADAGWTSLLAVPPYPDEPSGANCVFSGVMNSAKAFFGSDAAEFDIIRRASGR